MEKKIKLKRMTMDMLRYDIEDFKDFGYELEEVRPANWYEFLWNYVAIMVKKLPIPKR